MKYEAVLFDMDGTVLDTLDDLYDAVNHSLSRFGLPEVSRAQVRAGLGNGAANLIRCCLPAGTGPELHAQILEYYNPYYAAHSSLKTRPYEGIIPLMEKLKADGVKLAIISNKPDPAVKELAEHFFPGLLAQAVGESEGVPRKPDPASVLAAVHLLGVGKERCVYVGDSEVDVMTARNAGLDGIAVTWGFRDEEQLISAGAQHLAHSAEELEKILI